MTTPPINFDVQQVLNTQFELVTRLQNQAYLSPNAENLERFNLAVEGLNNVMSLTLVSLQITSQTGRGGGPD